ncbi:family 78 glycoside hydrolase catalytic domain [Paractinoplanes toevensis]|uniref:alpha-L-rhamnosidase n=1 Tax=Paractinoplanes toevensis TaxID=571911 RepID=A0A919VXU8_9ACTN|nr:family 78 glycoside hydrolase catalytic domain [Actinoplanes toevensis]GIM88292.1 alpha-L-rhamnosidase [Actinoplanes toevensis]
MTGRALRVEHLATALGIHVRSPRLSWQLPAGAARQIGYRLRGDNGWDTGRVSSDRSVLIPYDGPALASEQRVTWQVKVWTDRGEHGWSPPSWWEMGLLAENDWSAAWIAPETAGTDRPGYLLRSAFETTQPVVRARLHITAHGLYEAFLNGERVGDAELTPGFTQYRSRLQVQTYNVTEMIGSGHNVLGAILADGWFRGQTGALRSTDQWGTETALLAQLHLWFADGTERTVGTGPGWRAGTGHVRSADLIAGETWDLRQFPHGWNSAGFDDRGWPRAVPRDLGYATLTDSPAPPVRRIEEVVPVAVTELGPDRYVADLGQNINGWIRLGLRGAHGVPVEVTHAEALGAGGEVTTEHLRPAFPFLPEPLPAGMVDVVVPAGPAGATFEPRRTTHGFRYVRVEGQQVGPDDVRGIVVHTDLRRTGWFACSDDRINRLHEAAVWSLRDNACDIPTDCPQRERAGWTGDWQVFVPAAAFLYDVAGFSTKWLRDVAADQWPDGTVANMSPCPPAEGRDSRMAMLNGSAGWGDAVVIVPWQLYRSYGDERILAEMWPVMEAWIGRAASMARTRRHPERVARRPVAAPHEAYLWDSGFHWGEWLAPGEEPGDFPSFVAADKSDVATAYLAHSAGLMAHIAAVIGRDPAPYAALASGARDAWQREFLAAGDLTPDTQANHVRALAFDLVPRPLRQSTGDRLAALVEKAGTHLATGFLATPDLLPVLAEAGHLDVAYRLLFQDTVPSWLAMIDRGATTMWERWDGIDEAGVPHESLNHYAKGAVVSFLHRYVAGLSELSPGYRTFRVRPRPGGGLTWSHAAHETPYGRIEVRWSVTGGQVDLSVSVPPGTTAEAVLPDGTTRRLTPGEHHVTYYQSLLTAGTVETLS